MREDATTRPFPDRRRGGARARPPPLPLRRRRRGRGRRRAASGSARRGRARAAEPPLDGRRLRDARARGRRGARRATAADGARRSWSGSTTATTVAFDRRCPHLGCPVVWAPARGRFECPCHHAAFDARTGARPVRPAAPRPRPGEARTDAGVAASRDGGTPSVYSARTPAPDRDAIGILTSKAAPRPGALSTAIVPPSWVTKRLTM